MPNKAELTERRKGPLCDEAGDVATTQPARKLD